MKRISSAILVSALALVFAGAVTAAPLPGGTLDPLSIPKYVDPLPIPGAMPQTPNAAVNARGIDYYEIAVRQFQQQVLSTGTPLTTPTNLTTVWSYGSLAPGGVFHYPAFSIEATANRPVRVKWVNQLIKDPVACASSASPATDPACNYLSHLLPVDQTLHWANPAQTCANGMIGTDCEGTDPNPYTGPVPIVVHMHGSHVDPHSDGYPTAWWLPAANNIAAYAARGSNYNQIAGEPLEEGAAVYQYRNDQRATTLWFHDHSLGMTRTNVYAGPAGFYLLRGGPDDLSSGVPGGLPGGKYEIPLAIQDRSFNDDGSLFYPNSREFFDGYAGPYVPNPVSDISPIWNPEFFGNTNVVNGKTWPYLNVEPRKYRFRILNGSDSRFYILKFGNGNTKKLTFTQIGSEGGFLPAPVVLSQLLIGPAERADVIVDFSKFKAGDSIYLLNIGPDEPFGGPFPANVLADANTTGQVMQFRVIPLTAADTSAIPALPTITPVGAPTNTRQVSLNELDSAQVCVDRNNVYTTPVSFNPLICARGSAPLGPLEAELGTVNPDGTGNPLEFMAAITENPAIGATEEWEIHNFTADAHPIHVHQVMFQVVSRQVMGGAVRGPESWESGYKDTVISYPGEITRIKAVYDIPGLFVWHCHILSHEDNEMMRPFCVGGGCAP